MSNAIAGPGFFLQKGDGGAPENFTTIAEVRDIKGPAMKLDTEDVTNQSSPGFYEEVIATIHRPGEVTFDVNFIPTAGTHNAVTGLVADFNTRVLRHFLLQLNDGLSTKWTFSAFVAGIDTALPVIGVLRASFILRVSGQPILG